MASVYDCIVLGIGGVGSATLYHLARRRLRVLGLEQFGPAHDRGSSHGETRIIRRAYFEHPDYVPLVEQAFTLWRELEHACSRTLFTDSGLVLAGPPGSEAVEGTLRAREEHGVLTIRTVTLDIARREFPTFAFRDDDVVLHETGAGYLHVERCVAAHLDQARAAGATVHFDEPCRSWQAEDGIIRVTTDRGTYAASRLVVTAGPWTSRVLAGLGLPLTVLRKLQLWHPVAPGAVAAHRAAPGFLFDRPSGVFYGFPCLDSETIKIAEHSGGTPVNDPTHLDRDCHEADVQPVAGFIRETLPGVNPVPRHHAACMYTMTPDGHFIVDRHPHLAGVFLAAGFSGHGFKFASVIGDALAALVDEGSTSHPIGFLGLHQSRFGSAL